MVAPEKKRDKSRQRGLGIAREKRRYDLPLHKSGGTGFVILLIALMSFLSVLALASSFALSAITSRWSSGLENRATIEIPATIKNASGTNTIRDREETARLASAIAAAVREDASVKSATVMSEDQIAKLVKPWLGDNVLTESVPLPGLVSLRLRQSGDTVVKNLNGKISAVDPHARLDTHESWLADMLRFTGALKFAAIILLIVIGITTVTAVAGAVRARLAVHNEDVELLHLMGATDNYISRQFQRHSLILALKGALAGVAAGAVALMLIGFLFGEMDANLLPNFHFTRSEWIIFAMLPLLVTAIATYTARQTVLRVLKTIL